MLTKKGQAPAQVFVYIVAIVILGMILVFGYKAIRGFGEKGEEIELISFKSDIQNTFKQVRTSFGQVKNKEFTVPKNFDEMCIVDIDHFKLQGSINDDMFPNPILAAGVQEKNNVFLLKGIDLVGYNVGKLTVDTNNDKEENNDDFVLCFKHRQGKIRLLLKGMGDHVFVTKP